MKFRRILFITLILLIVFYTNEGLAQCAMCKANAESNLKSGETIAKGLNTGILYLMAIPYIILMTLFIIFFKKQLLAKYNYYRAKYFPPKIAS